MEDHASYPVLPYELERDIFEFAALQDHKMALQLALVSRRVLYWMEYIIYRVVALVPHIRDDSWSASQQVDRFMYTFDLKPAEFFGERVKFLWLDYDVKVEYAARIISACTGVEDLGTSLMPKSLPMEMLEPMSMSFLRPKRLSIDLSHFHVMITSVDHPPLFSNVTHLDLNCSTSHGLGQLPLEHIPCLTHLGLSNPTFDNATVRNLTSLLSTNENLKVLVLTKYFDIGDGDRGTLDFENLKLDDPRVVYVPVEDYSLEWERGAMGMPNFWTAADKIVANRQSSTCI